MSPRPFGPAMPTQIELVTTVPSRCQRCGNCFITLQMLGKTVHDNNVATRLAYKAVFAYQLQPISGAKTSGLCQD